jgi:potassium-transporting ATPase potassium-binding subunit
MGAQAWVQAALLVAALLALSPALGRYLANVFNGNRVVLTPVLGPVERASYRLLRVDGVEQDWKAYARAVMLFSVVSWLGLYAVLRLQGSEPLNPRHFGPGPWDLSFNTASSFVSNTSWQFYAGETTLSTFTQMAAIAVQSFASAAVGVAVAAALIRGLVQRGGDRLGNFWVDLVRILLYVLLPICVAGALVLASQGVVQTLTANADAGTLAGSTQAIALGPVASQEAVKLLSGDGGGFFNVNSAMPFENPTGFSNFVEIVLMLLLPAALPHAFGRMANQRREGWVLFAAMLAMFVAGLVVISLAEAHATAAMHAAGIHGPNLEGKELRSGVGGSALFAATSTASGDGAVNASMESLTALGGMVPMANMMTGEVVFGGPGSGLYGLLSLVLIAVFIAGLMVGRTPEYLGKQIEAREMKLALVGTLAVPVVVLVATAVAVGSPSGRVSLFAHGPQGFSESLYAYVSQGFNNGSAFAGYTGFVQPAAPGNAGAHGVTFADLIGGLVMLVGRYVPILTALALAGSLASRRVRPPGAGTLRTDTPTFGGFLIATVLLLALLTFVGGLLAGPSVQALTARLLS